MGQNKEELQITKTFPKSFTSYTHVSERKKMMIGDINY